MSLEALVKVILRLKGKNILENWPEKARCARCICILDLHTHIYIYTYIITCFFGGSFLLKRFLSSMSKELQDWLTSQPLWIKVLMLGDG